MTLTLFVHVLAAVLGLLTGYVALGVSKGSPLHRKAGMFFVYVMVTMAITGALMAVGRATAPAINIATALLTFYLVITGMTSVGSPAGWSRRLDVIAMMFGAATGAICVVFAVAAIGQGGAASGTAYPLVMFGAVALSAANGDRKVIRDGALKGSPRLMRHLWRMCFALFVSSLAFYLGRVQLPLMLRNPAFRAAGALLPLAAIAYWKWQLRARRPVRDLVRVAVEAA